MTNTATAPLPRGIRRRGNSYTVDVTVAGHRKTGTAHTLDKAMNLRHALRRDLQGAPRSSDARPVSPAWTIGHAVDVTEDVAWSGSAWGRSASRKAREFAAFVGTDAPLSAIGVTTLDRWSAHLEDQGKAPATINRYLAAVSKVFTTAYDRGGVAHRPKFPLRKEAKGRVRFLTVEEEQAMLSALDDPDARDLFVLLVDTGLRLGEALHLETRDADLQAGTLTVWQSKNGEPRTVPMTSRVREVVTRRLRGRQAGPVIAVERHRFHREWDRAKVTVGLADDHQFVPHALRHTCASRLVQRGVPLKVVQEWLGHKTITVTMRYSHLAPTNLLDAVKVLEA